MVVLGTTSMPIHQVMRLSRGAIIELDATEADEVKVLANNLPIASGVVLVDRKGRKFLLSVGTAGIIFSPWRFVTALSIDVSRVCECCRGS